MRPAVEKALLGAVLLGGATLRVLGIDHHLAHDPMDFDEMNNFVVPMLKMASTTSANPTVYSGYPGFFNWLAFIPTLVGSRLAGSYGAYVGARLVVAAFGVIAVLLMWAACRKLTDAPSALVAAALIAVSRGEVKAAHNIVPDAVVAAFALGALLTLEGEAGRRRFAVGGALVGVATAVKYTGLLALPSVLLAALLRRDDRKALLFSALIGFAVAFALSAPYALAASGGMGMGFDHSLGHYYGAGVEKNEALQGRGLSLPMVLGFFLADIGSWTGVVLILVAALLYRPRRALLPALALVATTLILTAPANKVFSRHVLPGTAAALLAVGVGFSVLRGKVPARWRVGGQILVLALLLGHPTLASIRMAANYRGPTTADRAVARAEELFKGRALLASAFEPFAPDPSRFEVRGISTLDDIPAAARRHYDLVVVKGLAPRYLPDVEIAEEFCDGPKPSGCDLTFLKPRHPLNLIRLPRPDGVRASENGQEAGVPWSESPKGAWRAGEGLSFLAARWKSPKRLARLELDAAPEAGSWPQALDLEAVLSDGRQQELQSFPLRPVRTRRQLKDAPHGEIYVLTPPVTLSELVLRRVNGGPWGVAALRAYDLDDAP